MRQAGKEAGWVHLKALAHVDGAIEVPRRRRAVGPTKSSGATTTGERRRSSGGKEGGGEEREVCSVFWYRGKEEEASEEVRERRVRSLLWAPNIRRRSDLRPHRSL